MIWWASQVFYALRIWGCRPPVLMADRPLSPPHLQLSISDLFAWSPKSLSWKVSLQRVSDREESPSPLLVNLIYFIYLLTCNAGGRGRSWTYLVIFGRSRIFIVKRCHQLTISRIPWIYAWAGCTKSPKTQVRERCSTIWARLGFRGRTKAHAK